MDIRPLVLMRSKNTAQIQDMIVHAKASPSGMYQEVRNIHTFCVARHVRTRTCPYDFCYTTTKETGGLLAKRTEYVNALTY